MPQHDLARGNVAEDSALTADLRAVADPNVPPTPT